MRTVAGMGRGRFRGGWATSPLLSELLSLPLLLPLLLLLLSPSSEPLLLLLSSELLLLLLLELLSSELSLPAGCGPTGRRPGGVVAFLAKATGRAGWAGVAVQSSISRVAGREG